MLRDAPRRLRSPPIQRLRTLLCLTRLEERTAPSAGLLDLPVANSLVDHADSFVADGQTIALLERSGELVVRLPPPSGDATPAPDRLFRGFTVEKQLDAATFILRGPADWAGPLQTNVAWAAPLFQSKGSDSWLAATNEIIIALQPGVAPDTFFGDD